MSDKVKCNTQTHRHAAATVSPRRASRLGTGKHVRPEAAADNAVSRYRMTQSQSHMEVQLEHIPVWPNRA